MLTLGYTSGSGSGVGQKVLYLLAAAAGSLPGRSSCKCGRILVEALASSSESRRAPTPIVIRLIMIINLLEPDTG